MQKAFSGKRTAEFGLLAAALAVGTVIAILQLVFSRDMYRDAANVYAFMARSLATGEPADAIHPAIPSLNVLLAYPFIKLGLRPEQALSLVSSLFYLATVPVLFLLLKRFVPGTPAAFGALLFVCAPKIIRFSCTSLIDSGKIFFLVAALYFAARLIEGKFRSYKCALGLGAALGGLSLARSEGIGNAVILFGCIGIYWLYCSIRDKRVMPLLPLLSSVFVWALAMLSRALVNWRFRGRFVFDERIHDGVCKLFGGAASAAPAASGAEPAWLPAARQPVTWPEFINNFIRGGGEVYFGIAAVGLALLVLAMFRWDKLRFIWPDKLIPEFAKWRGFYFILLASAFGNALIFKLSTIGAYRYFLPNIPLFMVFIVIAAYWLWSWTAKLFPLPLRIVCGIAVAGGLAIQVANGAENIFTRYSRKQYRSGVEAGNVMRKEKPDGRVWFHGAAIEWYYSGMKRAVPIETPARDIWKYDFDFVLITAEDDEAEAKIPLVVEGLEPIELDPDSTVKLYRKKR